MCVDCRRNPFHCIVPPHMLRVLEMRGDARQTEMARALLGQGREGPRRARAAFTATPDAAHAAARRTPSWRRPSPSAAPERHLNREIYDGEEQGGAARARSCAPRASDPTGDAAADAAYDGAGAVYDLYFDTFGRDSLDGQGHEARRHRPSPPQVQQRLLGRHADGLWRRRRADLLRPSSRRSVIGHEMSHGVVQFSGGLVYQGQSGALNESFADVFGSMMRQFAEKTDVYASDWLIGKGILGPEIQRRGAAVDEDAGDGLFRRAARAGPAALPHGPLRQHHRRQRRACTSTPASRTTPSISTAC